MRASSWVVSIRRMDGALIAQASAIVAEKAQDFCCRSRLGADGQGRSPTDAWPDCRWGGEAWQLSGSSTMKSVYFPVSWLMPWSETMSEAPAQSLSEMKALVSGASSKRSSTLAAVSRGRAGVAAG